jgi:hypothetical protein
VEVYSPDWLASGTSTVVPNRMFKNVDSPPTIGVKASSPERRRSIERFRPPIRSHRPEPMPLVVLGVCFIKLDALRRACGISGKH